MPQKAPRKESKMSNPNDTLPDNLKGLVENLSTRQAIPLGTMYDIPFLAVKIPAEKESFIQDNPITCEIKPSVFNVDFHGETVAVCFIQVRLNGLDEYIYTATYDLTVDKQFSDCYALLNMRKYGLFIASENLHDFLVFDAPFEAAFDPRNIIFGAKERSSDYSPELFRVVAHALYTQCENDTELWKHFETIAPFDKQWYARMQMDLQ